MTAISCVKFKLDHVFTVGVAVGMGVGLEVGLMLVITGGRELASAVA